MEAPEHRSTTGVKRWSMPADIEVTEARQALPQVHAEAVARVGVAQFTEDDDQLRDRIASELASGDGDEPPPVRAVLIRTGGRAELILAGSRGSASAAAQPSTSHPAGRTSLQVLREAGRPRLHLFHPGGGGTAPYRLLAANLPEPWTVTASDDIGRGDSVPALTDLYLRELLPARGVPEIVGGWSLGGLIGFHTARLLSAAGRRPPAVMLIDTPPPGSAGPFPGQPRLNLELAGAVWTALGRTSFCPVEIDTADDATTARVLAGALWRAGETLDAPVLEERLDTYRRHRRALVDYAVTDPLEARALLVAAALSDEDVRAWRRLLVPEPIVARLPVGHYEVLGPAEVHRVAGLLTQLAS